MSGKKKSGKKSPVKKATQNVAATAPEQLHATPDPTTIMLSGASNDILVELQPLLSGVADGLSDDQLLPWTRKIIKVLNLSNEKGSNIKQIIQNYFLPMHPDKWADLLPRIVAKGYAEEIFQLQMHGVDFARAFPPRSNEYKFFGTITLLSSMNFAGNSEQWSKILCAAFDTAKRIHPELDKVLLSYIYRHDQLGWAANILVMIFGDRVTEVTKLIDLGVDFSAVVSATAEGETPLHEVQSVEMLVLLTAQKPEAIYTKNNKGLMPVHSSVLSSRLDLVKVFVQQSLDSQGWQGKLEMLVGGEAFYNKSSPSESLLGFLALKYNYKSPSIRQEWLKFFIECCEFLAPYQDAQVVMSKACEHIQDTKSKEHVISRIRAASPANGDNALTVHRADAGPSSDAISFGYRQSLKALSEWDGDVVTTATAWANKFNQVFEAAAKEKIDTRKILLDHPMDGPEMWGERLRALVADRQSQEIFQLLLNGVDFSKVKTLTHLEKMFFVQVKLLSVMPIEGATGKWAASLLKAFATAQKIDDSFKDILFKYIYHGAENGWAQKLVLLINDIETPDREALAQVSALMGMGVKFALIKSDKVNGATPLHYVKNVACFDVLFHGNNVSHIFIEDSNGLLPVHYSVQHEKLALVQKFLEVAGQQPGEKNKFTMLTKADVNDGTLLDYIAQYSFKLEWAETVVWLDFFVSCCEFIKKNMTKDNEGYCLSVIDSARDQVTDNASIIYLHKYFNDFFKDGQVEQEAAPAAEDKDRPAHQACIDSGVDVLKDNLVSSFIARHSLPENGDAFLEKMRNVKSSIGLSLLQYAMTLEQTPELDKIITLISNVQNFEKMVIKLISDDVVEQWVDALLVALRLADGEFPPLKIWLLDKFYADAVPLWSNYLLSLIAHVRHGEVSQLIAAGLDFSKVSSVELKGATPLHMVTDQESLMMLLDQSADGLLVQNVRQEFPVHSCLRHNSIELVKMFIAAAAKEGPVLLDTMLTHKVDGKTLLELVIDKRAQADRCRSQSVLAWGLLKNHIERAQQSVNNTLVERLMHLSLSKTADASSVVDVPVAPSVTEESADAFDDQANTQLDQFGDLSYADKEVAHTVAALVDSTIEATDKPSDVVIEGDVEDTVSKESDVAFGSGTAVADPVPQELAVLHEAAVLDDGASDASVASLTDVNQEQISEAVESATNSESKGSKEVEAVKSEHNWQAFLRHVADKGLRNQKGKLTLPEKYMKSFNYLQKADFSLLHLAIVVDDSAADYKSREEGYQGKPGYQALQLIAECDVELLFPEVKMVYGSFAPPLHYACQLSEPTAVDVLLRVIAANEQAELMMRRVLGVFDARGMTARDHANALPEGASKQAILTHLDNASEFCAYADWSSAGPKKISPESKSVVNGKKILVDQQERNDGHSVAKNPNGAWESKRRSASQQKTNGSAAGTKGFVPKGKSTNGKVKACTTQAVSSNRHSAWASKNSGKPAGNSAQRHPAGYPGRK